MFEPIHAVTGRDDDPCPEDSGKRYRRTMRAALKALEAWPFSQHATERTARRTCWVHVDPSGDCDCGADTANAARDAAHAAVLAAWEAK